MPNYLPISSQYQCSPNNSLTISQHSLKSSIFCQDLPNSRSIFSQHINFPPAYQCLPNIYSIISWRLLNITVPNNSWTISGQSLKINYFSTYQCLDNVYSITSQHCLTSMFSQQLMSNFLTKSQDQSFPNTSMSSQPLAAIKSKPFITYVQNLWGFYQRQSQMTT